ncbi:hypothetical protein Mal15_25770 [Stieleria maiorica]|uniref:Uncharacterized protein n=1 Tax=Stieleria maiorica TaxID=2795974 RepID=A0A5B9MFZ9_9BACT|nr:hypothetical protein [Stieleria maiorica]QEF98525.1 hypothetical protein Mal15_25770 [Stieleria maiorica]
MSRKPTTRRASQRMQKAFPVGTLVALLTAVAVTLTGIIMGVESTTILTRAAVSALMVGSVVSIGVGVIRLADADYKD